MACGEPWVGLASIRVVKNRANNLLAARLPSYPRTINGDLSLLASINDFASHRQNWRASDPPTIRDGRILRQGFAYFECRRGLPPRRRLPKKIAQDAIDESGARPL